MISAAEIRQKANQKLDRALGQLVAGENPFPIPIPYKKPANTATPSEILEAKRILRAESKEANGYGPSVEFLTVRTRKYAEGTVPGPMRFDTLEDLAKYARREAETERVLKHARIVTEALPNAKPWAAARPLRFAKGDVELWKGICAVVDYFLHHPKPWVYARELPVKVHTKFLEENHAIVIDILATLAPEVLSKPYTSWQDRLGLRSKSNLVEGRFLDEALAPGFPLQMLAATEDWNRSHFGAPRSVLITENRTTFLTLPPIPGCLAFLGKGYAVKRLAELTIMAGRPVTYWGDIDQHGFEILASLRAEVPDVTSALMNEETLEEYRAFATKENVEGTLDPAFVAEHLTDAERQLWQRCVITHARLEQERLPVNAIAAWVRAR